MGNAKISDSTLVMKKGSTRKVNGHASDNKKQLHWEQMSLRQGSKVEVFSEMTQKWHKGQVVKEFKEKGGEWLRIKYNERYKEVQRFNNLVRPRGLNSSR